jgi:hypothetical protein
MEAQCPFYIERQADTEVVKGVNRHRGLVTLQGPSQTGKTSMMLQLYDRTRNSQHRLRPVIVDFQGLCEDCFASLPAIWQAILTEVDTQLNIGVLNEHTRHPHANYDHNLTEYLKRYVFADEPTPVLLCLDEVNRVFGKPVRSAFFPSVRSFFNRGAYDPTWKKLRWLLSTSSEPRFFIDDLNQSPFNVGAHVMLRAFNFQETACFVNRYGFSEDEELVQCIMTHVGGRPYLVHLLLYHLAQNPQNRSSLFDAKSAGGGVFKPHLDHYLTKFQKQKDLSVAMQRVIAGKGCSDVRLAERLSAAGLVKEDGDGKIVCACQLYATYLGQRL